MTRIPLWIRLTASVVLAIVLAVGGSLLGTRLAPAATPDATPPVAAEPLTEPAVVAPQVPTSELPDGFADEADVAAFLDGVPASTATVAVPVEPVSTLALVEELSGALVEADDPETLLSLGGGLVPPADPCVADPTACPAGVVATVLPLLDRPYPSLRIVRAGQPTATWATGCRVDGRVAYAIETTTPVSGDVALWAHADRTLTGGTTVQTTAAQEAAWQSDARARGSATIVHCLGLTFPGTGVHEVVISLASPDGETATLDSQVDASGGLSMPRVAIFAPSEDVITAIVPSRPGQRVEYSLHDLSEGEQPVCGAPRDEFDSHIRQLVRPRHYQVTEEYLAGRNEMAGVTERETVSWVVGEGRHVFVCIQISDGDLGDPRVIFAIVSTRDVPVPVVRVWGMSNPTSDTMIVNGSTGTGGPCGYYRVDRYRFGTPGTADPRPEPPLCDYGEGGSTGVESDIPDGREIPLSGGYLDRYTVSISPERDPTDVYRSTIDLAALRDCGSASCPVPAPSYHVVRDPESGRMLVLEVAWTGGAGLSGVSRTTVTRIADSGADRYVPYPMLDRTVRTEASVSVGATGRVFASITTGIRVDQSADYVIRLVPPSGQFAICRYPGSDAPVEYSGTYLPPETGDAPIVPIRFDGLCPGSTYQVEVVLTATFSPIGVAPSTSVWGQQPRPAGAPPGAYYGGALVGGTVTVPGGAFRIVPTMAVLGSDVFGDGDAAFGVTLTLNGAALAGPGVAVCGVAPEETAAVPIDPTVLTPERGTTVRVAGTIQPLSVCPDAGGGWTIEPDEPPVTFAFDVQLEQLSDAGITSVVWDESGAGPRRPAAVIQVRF